VHDAHDAIVLLQNDPALLHLGEERFLERLQAYVDLAPALRDRVPEIDYVDMRFEERVYVRPVAAKGR
jgi:cell division septal protein FtsQ